MIIEQFSFKILLLPFWEWQQQYFIKNAQTHNLLQTRKCLGLPGVHSVSSLCIIKQENMEKHPNLISSKCHYKHVTVTHVHVVG